MARKQKMKSGKKPGRAKRIWGYTGIILGVIILGAVGFGAYEYHRLQPTNHFGGGNSPVIGGSTTKVKQAKGTFNVLLLGSDERPGNNDGHTDSIMLVHVDLNTHTYNMLSIPRDTRVYMDGVGYTKLTSVQYLAQVKEGSKQGIITAVKAISKLTGVPINYYAETNYGGLQNMVDALGGINMDLPFDVTLTHPWYKQDQGLRFTKGEHFLDGKMVTEVVHERDSVPGTDFGRQKLQEEALVSIAKTAMSPANVTKLPKLSKSLSSFLLATNMSTQDLLSLGLGVKGNFSQKQIHYYQLKGTSETIYDQALQANNDEVVIDTAQMKKIIDAHFKG